MTSDSITFVGMDAHKRTISIALLRPGSGETLEWQEANTPEAVRRLARRLKKEAPDGVSCCYEAGPTGYALWRQLNAAAVPCAVIAPSLIPIKPGSRIKTDKRDARKLAELFRAGLLTEVKPPSESEEALRDLCRCRDNVRIDYLRARHRLGKFLLRRHLIYNQTKNHWGTRHMIWLRQLRFEDAASQATFDSYLLAVDQLSERKDQLDAKLAELASQDPYREPVAWLRCFRGIDTVTAISLVAEPHNIERFHAPRALMAYLGLVPSERSSGESERRGAITKAGNGHVRRLLIEAAWHQRHRPSLPAPLRKRREGQPTRVIALADKAQLRLNRGYVRMSERARPLPKIVVAMARELTGYLWAVLRPEITTQ